jgi:hypothetical protein
VASAGGGGLPGGMVAVAASSGRCYEPSAVYGEGSEQSVSRRRRRRRRLPRVLAPKRGSSRVRRVPQTSHYDYEL